MSLNDTNEVNALETMAPAITPPNNLNNAVTNNDDCPHEGFRDNYNCEVAALKSKMAEVSSQLTSLNSLQTEVSRTTWQSIQALNVIERRLAARPPAKPPGSILPLDMYDQAQRGKWWKSIVTGSLDDGIDVVLAHHIPQPKSHDISLNQIIPAEYLNSLRPPIQGRNGSQLYLLAGSRRNSRAMVHVGKGAGEILGDALWVPCPLETERWFPLIVEKPSHDVEQSSLILHEQSIERFTIDSLHNGMLLLSFARPNDQVLARIALSG